MMVTKGTWHFPIAPIGGPFETVQVLAGKYGRNHVRFELPASVKRTGVLELDRDQLAEVLGRLGEAA